MKQLVLAAMLCAALSAAAQPAPLYFPPLTGSTWETVPPASLGWNETALDSLFQFLGRKQTKAFLILVDGRIVVERYFDSFTRDSIWYWASAGKTVTAFLTGMAQEEGLLALSDTTADYLGTGWTAAPPDKEEKITVWHQLTMTSGLDDTGTDPYCTLGTCLEYLADAGTRWAYHNAPYTLLDSVIHAASGLSLNQFYQTRLRNRIGMNGLFLKSGYNNILFSNARSMARFGLMMLGGGRWAGTPVMTDTAYYRQMITPSQALNKSYGYLWWLNGQESFMLPQVQFVFPGSYAPAAPPDMYAGLGKNGQILNVVPSRRMVLVRMGNPPGDGGEVTPIFNNDIWTYLNQVLATATAAEPADGPQPGFHPNPAGQTLHVTAPLPGLPFSLELLDAQGRPVRQLGSPERIDLSDLPAGLYLAVLRQNGRQWAVRIAHR
jgi:CubicO group peptidase (beta-lactamase class C family)